MKRLLILLCSFWIITGFVSEAGSEAPPEEKELKLYSQSAVLIDGTSGRVLYGKAEQKQRPMASTTKIMTCIVALENGNLEDVVPVSANAARQPKVHLGLKSGEEIYLKDLLYSLMLESHNDSAVAIAEHIGGSVEGFAQMMNQKARDLGCENTYFITPNGLDATVRDALGQEQIHSTTAAELARIMKYCVRESPQSKEFLNITRTQNYAFSSVSGKRSFSCVNHNALLTMMSGVLSGKTGFTSGAGYSYIAAVEDDGRIYIAALLGCGWPPHKTYKWSDVKQLFSYGKENFHNRNVFEPRTFPEIVVLDGVSESGDLTQAALAGAELNLEESEQTLKLLLREDETVLITDHLPQVLQAPVRKGDVIGEVTYALNDEIVASYPVYADRSVDKIDLSWCFRKVWQRFFL